MQVMSDDIKERIHELGVPKQVSSSNKVPSIAQDNDDLTNNCRMCLKQLSNEQNYSIYDELTSTRMSIFEMLHSVFDIEVKKLNNQNNF
jgi:hypothetical protein